MASWGANQGDFDDGDWEESGVTAPLRKRGEPEAASPTIKAQACVHRDHDEDEENISLRRRSVLAYNHGATHKDVDEGEYPTNVQVVEALQLKVAKSVEVARRYRRNALMVDGSLSVTFNNEDEVLAYLANKILLPTWKDPVCGDGAIFATVKGLTAATQILKYEGKPQVEDSRFRAGQCEYPWEFPAYGRFGCGADCGMEPNTTSIAINIKANFLGHPSISSQVLMSSVQWNLCLNDPERTARGEADLCWWEKDQRFSDIKVNIIEAAEVIDGNWYILIKGDYTGRVSGTVYDLTDPEKPVPVELTPQWEKCRLPNTTDSPASSSSSPPSRLRSLLTEYKDSREKGNEDPQLFRKLQMEHFPDKPNLSTDNIPESLQERLNEIEAKRQHLERIRDQLKELAEQRRLTEGGAPDTSQFE